MRVGEVKVDGLVGGDVEEVDVGVGEEGREFGLVRGGQGRRRGEEGEARVELRQGLEDEGLDVGVLVGDDGVQLLLGSRAPGVPQRETLEPGAGIVMGDPWSKRTR